MSKQQGTRNEADQARTLATNRPLLPYSLLLSLAFLPGCISGKPHLASDKQQERAHQQLLEWGETGKNPDDDDAIDVDLSGFFKNLKYLFDRKPSTRLPADTLVLRGDQIEVGKIPIAGTVEAELAGARELFARKEYSKAERIFHRLADNKKNPPPLIEEARFHEAECLRLQGYYPKAADVYNKLLMDFPSTGYRDQACHHMFDIANWWLEGTRKQMRQAREQQEGKRWLVEQNFFHWDRSMPFMDVEGRAIEKLEQVRFNDITGPLADRALFMMGGVKFFNEDYVESDHYFSQLVEMHPNSQFATQAVELAIISKHMSTGGADYDSRKVGEARQMVHTALMNYPELARQKTEFLQRQLIGITMQQAEKDYKIAEFYRRTGHPCSAYFYYEIVRRRYPGVQPYFDLATQRMHELRAKVEREQGGAAPAVPPAQLGSVPEGPPAQAEQAPQPRPLSGVPETAPQPRPLPSGVQ